MRYPGDVMTTDFSSEPCYVCGARTPYGGSIMILPDVGPPAMVRLCEAHLLGCVHRLPD